MRGHIQNADELQTDEWVSVCGQELSASNGQFEMGIAVDWTNYPAHQELSSVAASVR